MVKVKVCGITREEDVKASVEAGADALGFVVGFEDSPRNLSLKRAIRLIRVTPVFVTRVLVTPYKGYHELKTACEALQPDAVQLYGCSDVSLAREACLGAKLIKPLDPSREKNVERSVEGYDAALLDRFDKDKLGGTGKEQDWGICKEVRRRLRNKPVILAGGLNQDNVIDAILTVRPYAVDVSSGVESKPGIKDRSKIAKFVAKAKEVDIIG